jgi:hypothetical protein
MVWVAITRGASLSLLILLALACGWQDDSLLTLYVCLTGLTNGLLSVGLMQAGACLAKRVEFRGKGIETSLHLVTASVFGVGEALGCLIGFIIASSVWV